MRQVIVAVFCISIFSCQSIWAKDDLEQYVKDHFEDLYKKYNNFDQQSLRLLELQRQIEDLRQDNRLLRSQVEELARSVKKLSTEALSPVNAPPLPPMAEKLPAEKDWDRQTLFKAKSALRSGEFSQAINLLEPLSASKVAEVAVESQYWLGLAYVSQKNCSKGMIYLKSFTQTSSDSALAPEALLAYGLCQKSGGDVVGYRDTMERLKKRYPQSTAAKNSASDGR